MYSFFQSQNLGNDIIFLNENLSIFFFSECLFNPFIWYAKVHWVVGQFKLSLFLSKNSFKITTYKTDLWFSKIIALVIFVDTPEFPKLFVGIFWTGSFPHLRICSNPLICNPFTTNHYRAASMAYPPIIPPIFVHVPPNDCGTFCWFNICPNSRKYSIAT